MFWGLVLEPGKRYAQTVDTAFHVSMACLETKPSDNETTSVILDHNDREFILCSLQRQRFLQSQLDLNFSSGEKIAFLTSGQGKVHLTGYLIEPDEDDDDDDDFEMPEDADSAISLSDKLAGKMSASAKRKKKQNAPKEEKKKQKITNEVDDDESDFPTSDLEDDSDEVELGSGDEEESDDDDNLELDEEDEEEEDSEEEDSDKATSGIAKNTSTTSFSTAGSTPFHKKHEGKEKLATPGSQKGDKKSPKQTPVSVLKKEKTPLAGNINGTPGEKSGKKKKNKNKGDSASNTPVQGKNPGANITPAKTPKQQLAGGVVIEESKIGNGPVAKQGSYVTVFYTGRLKQNNKQFDAVNQGTGFKFRLGSNEVIRGWDIGIPGMKVGGKRKIVIPPQMAYGNKGSPPVIPPNSALVFEVELRNVK
ncbi:46 kDa FK506-binding nuclear protein-like [Bacillus rossius redtenbacheri]|uniref:46 kDa FK506-binding nuclear protein-like n=1 Tax=Bacillus rossius redtenbacheri TaxID=93214 RepID=UPI002FDCC5B3